MTQVKFKTDKLLECRCGFKPNHYTVGYGSTPYDVWCPNCKKQTTLAKCLVTSHSNNLFDYWNTHIRHLTKEDVDKEVDDFRKIQKKNIGYDLYKRYDVYWVAGEGEVIVKSV